MGCSLRGKASDVATLRYLYLFKTARSWGPLLYPRDCVIGLILSAGPYHIVLHFQLTQAWSHISISYSASVKGDVANSMLLTWQMYADLHTAGTIGCVYPRKKRLASEYVTIRKHIKYFTILFQHKKWKFKMSSKIKSLTLESISCPRGEHSYDGIWLRSFNSQRSSFSTSYICFPCFPHAFHFALQQRISLLANNLQSF